MENEWREELPPQCPPNEASVFSGYFYRLVETLPPQQNDFDSGKKIFPSRVFNVSECIAHACSVFTDFDGCKKQKKYAYLRCKKIVRFRFEPNFGLVLKTFGTTHYSWWVFKTFIPECCSFEEIRNEA